MRTTPSGRLARDARKAPRSGVGAAGESGGRTGMSYCKKAALWQGSLFIVLAVTNALSDHSPG